jgi:hypothetical protein
MGEVKAAAFYLGIRGSTLERSIGKRDCTEQTLEMMMRLAKCFNGKLVLVDDKDSTKECTKCFNATNALNNLQG